MLKPFVDREEHLAFLTELYGSDGSDLVLIYGRRRVGKTELIKRFIEDKPHIYCLSSLEDKERQLESIADSIHNYFGGIKPEINRWEDLFEYFKQKAEDGLVLVIDEFPYLMEQNRSISSYFQKFIDEYIPNKNLMVILCGSSIGMMQDLTSYKNPLYGRRSGQIDLTPFGFKDARKMLPTDDIEEEIKFYSIFGGVPFYLQKVTEPTIKENIKEKVCRNVEILYEEPTILLREEFRKPNRYFSMMESIASGKTTPKKISDDTKIPQQSIPKYLGELEKIRLIKHETPVTERKKRSRKGIYKISDNYFDFWFRFIAPHLSDIEENHESFVDDYVMPDLDMYVGEKFEEICREFLWLKSRSDRKLNFTKIGKWWYKEEEIDIIALNEKEKQIYFGECKWSKNKVDPSILYDVKGKAESVRWKNRNRLEKFILFSKGGFTKDLKKKAENENIELFGLDDLENEFSQS